MKKSLFLIPIAALAMASCSSEEPVVNNPSLPTDAEGNVYLTFGLVNSTGLTTRADEEFQAGSGAESKISKVRFLFFDKNDNPAAVKFNGADAVASNWYDYDPTAEGGAGTDEAVPPLAPNVEQIVNATIVLNTKDFTDQNYPTQVVALINPTQDLGKNLSLADLKSQVSNYTVDDQNGFLMSSSVYAENSKAVLTVDVATSFYSDKETALQHPVTLYVDRVAAKVVLGISVAPTRTNLYPTGQKDYNGNDIYVDIEGWNVTTTVGKTNLIKNINTAWNFDWAWNWAENHRSYWAVNPTLGSNDYSYTAWSDAAKKTVGTGAAYLRENASNDFATGNDPVRASQVILYGTLCNADGTPLPLVEYKMLKYNPNDINQIVYNTLGQKIYKEDGSEINPSEDIVFVTSTKVGKNTTAAEPNWKGTGTYYVYAQLKAGNKYSYSTDGTDQTAQINTNLINTCGPVKYWNGGATYYYVDIAHLNPNTEGKPGAHGIVRNHLYDIDVTNLVGLGTPVYDKDEEIVPEHPVEDYGMVAAQINVLSWKVVKQSADLEW